MKNTKLIALTLLILFAANSASAQNTQVTVIGSNTVFPIMERTAARFQSLNPDISIDIQGPGSGAGATAIINGQTDVAPMSRAPKEAELEAAAEAGKGLAVVTIALDALVVIVNNGNPITELSVENITSIFEGSITSWTDLGWSAGGSISIIERDENSGTHDYFNDFFLDGEEVDPTAVFSHSQQSSTRLLFELVALDTNAIGYGGLAYLDDTVSALTIDGVQASKDNARDGSYPLARPLFLVYDILTISNVALKFVKYNLSPEGQFLAEDTGYVAVLPALTALDPDAKGYGDAAAISDVDKTPFFFSQIMLTVFVGIVYIFKRRS